MADEHRAARTSENANRGSGGNHYHRDYDAVDRVRVVACG
jgi:hypothetical protein